jgi:selenide,water dikinase
MAHLSGVSLRIHYNDLQWLPGAQRYAEIGAVPGGTSRNRAYFEQWVQIASDVDDTGEVLLYDPQTSGGLLMSVSSDRAPALTDQLVAAGEVASVIGEVIPGDGQVFVH